MKKSPPKLRFAVLAADTVLCTIRDKRLFVRLIAVNRPPHFRHAWGLPGGLIHPTETAEEAARRNLSVKAHIGASTLYMEQLYTFSAIDRDPRGRVVAVAYLALIAWDALSPQEQRDTPETRWVPMDAVGALAYDHNEILKAARKRLRSRAASTTILVTIMPDEFTLTELENAYECIMKTDLDKRNFRKKILKLKIVRALPKKRTLGRARPATLYRFASPDVTEIKIL
ncbi:MAG: NUDIX hydrolase [Candidatus Niyogibacteria bacterium]|nr:NUDIX hydrolase [Candidatus Niyogibacteria bacterium]